MDTHEFFWNFYYKVQRRIIPTLKYSQTIYEEFLFKSVLKNDIWLDLGCGHSLLPMWRVEAERELSGIPKCIIGLDYVFWALVRHSSIRDLVRGDISNLPFRDNYFSLITANMVFEHLKDPESQLSEICRVLKPGGRLIFHTPNRIGYTVLLAKIIPEKMKSKIIYWFQRRKEEDVFQAFYRINVEKEIIELARKAKFKVKILRMIVSSAQLVVIPPVVVIELFLIKLLMRPSFRKFRTNIIVVLEKK